MQSTAPVKEFKFKNATVRMHGTPNRENLEKAALEFLKAIEKQRLKEESK